MEDHMIHLDNAAMAWPKPESICHQMLEAEPDLSIDEEPLSAQPLQSRLTSGDASDPAVRRRRRPLRLRHEYMRESELKSGAYDK
jgi:hypothetical protein